MENGEFESSKSERNKKLEEMFIDLVTNFDLEASVFRMEFRETQKLTEAIQSLGETYKNYLFPDENKGEICYAEIRKQSNGPHLFLLYTKRKNFKGKYLIEIMSPWRDAYKKLIALNPKTTTQFHNFFEAIGAFKRKS